MDFKTASMSFAVAWCLTLLLCDDREWHRYIHIKKIANEACKLIIFELWLSRLAYIELIHFPSLGLHRHAMHPATIPLVVNLNVYKKDLKYSIKVVNLSHLLHL